jgi:hypothetical protein
MEKGKMGTVFYLWPGQIFRNIIFLSTVMVPGFRCFGATRLNRLQSFSTASPSCFYHGLAAGGS